MRFKTYFLTENALQNILKMFGSNVPGTGATTFGANATAGAAAPQTGGTVQNTPSSSGPNPKLLSITGATPDAKAKTAIDAINKGFKISGKDPAITPMQMDRAAIMGAASAAIQSGQTNKLDSEGITAFANDVNPADLQQVLGAERTQKIQQPQQQAVAAATQAGAQLAGR